MKRLIGILVLVLGGIGLIACIAGVVGLWVGRTPALEQSLEMTKEVEDALKVVEQKAEQAGGLLATVKKVVDPVTQKITELGDKAKNGDPEDRIVVKQLREELTLRFQQIETFLQLSQSALELLKKTSKLAKTLPMGSSAEAMGDLEDTTETVARLEELLKTLRSTLNEIRDNKEVGKEVVDAVVDLALKVNREITFFQGKVNLVRQRAAQLQAEASEVRTNLPIWITTGVILGTVILVWMGLGQLALTRYGVALLGKNPSDS